MKLDLENLKIGDEVVSVRQRRDGKLEYGGVRIVTARDERVRIWRYANPAKPEKNIGAFPYDGGCRDFMSKSTAPDFHFSANSVHIRAARKAAARAAAEAAKDLQRRTARHTEFMAKLQALLDEYGAEIYAVQTNGDDQGVEMDVFVSSGRVQSKI